MKKIFTIAVLQLILCARAFSQDYGYTDAGAGPIDYDRLRFGVFFAPNISWMKPTASKSDNRMYFVDNNGSRGGYTWGLMVDYFFSDNYGISSGFNLNTTGGKILTTYDPAVTPTSTTSIVKSANFNYRLQYIEVPFNLKLRSDYANGGMSFFGNIGATLGINVSRRATYEVVYTELLPNGSAKDNMVAGENEKLVGTFAIAPALLQFNVGGGVEYPIGERTSLYAGLFFNNGFAPDVTNPKEYKMGYSGSFSDGSIRLNNFALRLGLFF